MEREEIQIQAPIRYMSSKKLNSQPKKKKAKKRTLQRAQYQIIPTPMKFSSVATFFALYADIGLRTYQGSLHHDTRSMNLYCDVLGIEMIKEQNYQKISLTIQKKVQIELPAWQNLIEGLLDSESNELRGWGTRIKNFSIGYEQYHRELSREEGTMNGFNQKELMEITEKTERKLARYLKEYPCIYFTSVHEKYNSSCKETCFNEQYLHELGYTLETFSATVLQEGIPSMLPYDNICSTKLMLDNYYTLGKDGVETPEIISDLSMKNGYLKRVRYKVIFLPSYRNRVYHMTGIVVILGRENSFVIEDTEEKCEWNKTFLKKIIKKEKDINKFMKMYYDRTLILPHTSAHKVCKIRELNTVKCEEEEVGWILKKEEC